jgi:hypothetical protein
MTNILQAARVGDAKTAAKKAKRGTAGGAQ